MESNILDTLGFECTTPTIKLFLRRFCQAAEGDVPDDRCVRANMSAHPVAGSEVRKMHSTINDILHCTVLHVVYSQCHAQSNT